MVRVRVRAMVRVRVMVRVRAMVRVRMPAIESRSVARCPAKIQFLSVLKR